jgi:hypothetical protein
MVEFAVTFTQLEPLKSCKTPFATEGNVEITTALMGLALDSE